MARANLAQEVTDDCTEFAKPWFFPGREWRNNFSFPKYCAATATYSFIRVAPHKNNIAAYA